jgi:Acetyltransferase (GNAT) domain
VAVGVKFQIRTATAADAPGVRRIFAAAFGRELTAEEWEWKYPRNPDGWISVVAEAEGRIVGHYGGWPMRAIIGGRERTIMSLGDVITEKSVRALGGRRNVFRSMAERMFAILRERDIPFGFGFPNPRAFVVGERLLGYRAHFPVREIVFDLPPALPRASDAVASEWVDTSFDGLWERARGLLRCGLVRDRQRMNWRYHARPDRYYRFVTVRDSDGDLALGVLSLAGDSALVVDALLGDPSPATSRRLFHALSGEAAAMGARRLVFWETPGGPLAALAGRHRRSDFHGVVRDAGYAFVTAVVHEEDAIASFVEDAQISAGIYDDR